MKSTTYLLRDVPEQLHREWYVMATMKDMSMRKYALRALLNQVEHDKSHIGAVQEEVEGGQLSTK
jgi:hypothetical protein